MTAGLGSVAGGFWTQNTNETQQNEHYFQTLHTFWLGPCKEVLVKVWPGVDGALGIWPTGATSGLNCGGGWAPAPNISDMNCLVKSSALVAWPDLFWFRAWTIALFGGPELGCGGGGWAAFPGTLKKIWILYKHHFFKMEDKHVSKCIQCLLKSFWCHLLWEQQISSSSIVL